MPQAGTSLSVSAVARRLGISRSMVWRMIADGYLDAESVRQGRRLVTRVEVPEVWPNDPPGSPARSRTMRLQEQVDRLTELVEELTARLVEARRDQEALMAALRRSVSENGPDREAEAEEKVHPPAMPGAEVGPFPAGITARPNPMTHPASVISSWRFASREEALAPLRALLQPETRRGPWWQRLAAR